MAATHLPFAPSPSSPRPYGPRASAPRPWLPPPPQQLYSGHLPSGTVHFTVHPSIAELQQKATELGWFARGWTELSVPWVEVHYSTDGWKTTRVLRSTDVPCPLVNGYFYLPHVLKGETVDFAVHAGLSCRAPEDTAGERAQASVWLNTPGQNFQQKAK
ncbi:MAG: hypothetical protein K1X89_14250 [Myxococcaceae bacterium]|nr:hypothetical protein [Myxococcaceae bacterium]